MATWPYDPYRTMQPIVNQIPQYNPNQQPSYAPIFSSGAGGQVNQMAPVQPRGTATGGYTPLYQPRTPEPINGPVRWDVLKYLQEQGLSGDDVVDLAHANTQVSSIYDPQEDALKQYYDRLNMMLGRDITTQENYGREGDQRLNDIYNQLNGQLQSGLANTGALYANAQQQVSQGYDQARQATDAATGDVRDRLVETMQRLGLEQAAPDPLNSLESGLELARVQNANSKASAVGNLQALGGNMQAIAQQAVSDAAREGAAKRGDLVTSIQNAISDAQANYGMQQSDVLQQLNTLLQQRPRELQDVFQKNKAATAEGKRQAALDQFAQMIQMGTLNLQQQELGLKSDQFDWQKQMDAMGMSLDQQKLQLELMKASTSNPLEQAKIQAQIDEINSRTALNQNKLLNPTANGKPTNQQMLDQFLSSASPYWGPSGAGPNFRNTLTNIIDQAYARAAMPQYDVFGKPTQSGDAFTLAMSLAGDPNTRGSMNLAALQQALKAYFGK